jgi:hypothetical protein
MREAGRINALALAAAKAAIRPGVTTAELDALAAEVIRKHGAKPAFLGVPWRLPLPGDHHRQHQRRNGARHPRERKLKEGDIVSIDCGTNLRRICGRLGLYGGVGAMSPWRNACSRSPRRRLYIGIEKLRAGNRVGDVGAAIQKFVESHGYHVPREYTGHGVGRHVGRPQVPNYGISRAGMVSCAWHDDRPGTDGAGGHAAHPGAARSLDGGIGGWFADRSLRAQRGVTDGPLILTEERGWTSCGLKRVDNQKFRPALVVLACLERRRSCNESIIIIKKRCAKCKIVKRKGGCS